jgi:hypothetical protein
MVAATLAAPVPAQPPRGKAKWEYKVLSRSQLNEMAPKGSKDKLTDTLNQLGDEGWELVTIASSTGSVFGGGNNNISTSHTYAFKRQR